MQKSGQRFQIAAVLVAICLPFITSTAIKGHNCEVKFDPEATHSASRLQSDYMSGRPSRLRLTAVYTDNFKRLRNYRAIAQTFVEPGLAFWRSALKVVKPLKTPLKLRAKCNGGRTLGYPDGNGKLDVYCAHGCASSQMCYNVQVPKQYVDNCKTVQNGKPVNMSDGGSGVAGTDYLVFVDYKSTGCGPSTIAYAIQCQQDKTTDRPEIGIINYCPHYVDFKEASKNNIKFTTIHELAHAFGFTWHLMSYMRDENNQPRTRRDSTWNLPNEGTDSQGFYKPSSATGEEVTRWWLTAEKYVQRTTRVLRTPYVLKAARAHFNCPTLDGVELENNGGSGTAFSHFEKRLFYNDVMVGSETGEAVVSNLTLGFFKDTGWYDVDFSRATDMKWGKGLGCEFATQSCYQYLHSKRQKRQNTYPWCDKVDHYCRLDKKYCTMAKMTQPVPEIYRYATPSTSIRRQEASYYAGNDWLMDYCPYDRVCGVSSS